MSLNAKIQYKINIMQCPIIVPAVQYQDHDQDVRQGESGSDCVGQHGRLLICYLWC